MKPRIPAGAILENVLVRPRAIVRAGFAKRNGRSADELLEILKTYLR